MERIIIGTTEAVNAEFGFGDFIEEPFMILVLYNNEPVSAEGFETLKDADASITLGRELIERL